MKVFFSSLAQALREVRGLSLLVVGCSALTFALGCPDVEPPIEDGGPVDAGNDPEPKDGGNDPEPDGGPEPNPTCGNGVVEPPEECDDGNNSQTDACKNDCSYNICGDGYVYTDIEDCDVGDTANGDGCSAVCLNEAPPLPENVTVSGTVYNRKYKDQQPVQNVELRALQVTCNGTTPCASTPPYTGADGAYSIGYVPPQSAFTLEMRSRTGYEEAGEPGPYAVRIKAYSKDQATETVNPYWVQWSWLAEVAVACGIYEAGAYDATNYPNRVEGHPDFVTRAAFMGMLKDGTGAGVGGVTKDRIQVELGGYLNNNPDYVCFLNVDGTDPNRLVGSASNTSYAEAYGAFIVFKAKNANNLGLGTGYVRVAYAAGQANFEEASVAVQAGNLALSTLYTDDNPNPEPPPLDVVSFADVYQVLQNQGCTACHYEGGAGDVQNGGYYARYNLTPQEVYDNLVGPGTNCTVTDYVGNYRVCVNDPAASRLLKRPLLEEPADHPNASFGDTNDPNYQLLYAWIEQGAQYNVVDPPVEYTYTLYGVMDIATQRGCTACHGYNVDYGGTGRPAGNMALNGCEQYYIDNNTYADNGVDYDPATNPDYYKRDCVYYHLKNAGVDDDPYGYGYRVNPDYPERSMLLRNPYCGPYYCADDPDYPETHPVKVFANDQDPGYLNIYSWIEDGAQNNGSADELYLQP